MITVSAKKGTGLEDLRNELEKAVLKYTGRHIVTVRVFNGGDEIRWLYKNGTVVSETPDENDQQFVRAKVIITDANLQKFKHYFIKNN
ncbi:hypothetical protein JTB14_029478 [Gonioctena quinquepunctata]|nr:hypothetical protein JTB14_029478 [Gonioctena quinquepunctata]